MLDSDAPLPFFFKLVSFWILPFAILWMNLEDVMQMKLARQKKFFSFSWSYWYVESKRAKYIEAESRPVVIRGREVGKMES